MIDLSKHSLEALGWTSFFQRQLEFAIEAGEESLSPARVIRQDINRYHLITPGHNLMGALPGKSRLQSKSALPTVGDWVLVPTSEIENQSDEPILIHSTLPRETKFSRKEAGEKLGEQVIAANINVIFIVTGLDDNFNLGRIERYLLLTWQSGASPIIVLNKADVCKDLAKKLRRVAKIAADTPVHTISALNNEGLSELLTYIQSGTTVAVLGSSGVGKSTLINQMLGTEHFATGAVREIDSKGRHTTTHRELCGLDSGGMIIDTPGMRELQLWAGEDSLHYSFEDIESFAAQCKFNDCAHESEPHCAIRLALEKGKLAQSRFNSYKKFQSELISFKQRLAASRQPNASTTRRRSPKKSRKNPKKT